MESLPVNATDAAVVVVLLLSAAVALMRGFVHEVLSLGAWAGAALATVYALPYVQPYTREVIAIPLLADIVSGVVLFLVVLVALSLLGRLVGGMVQRSGLSALDRSLGLLFGVLRGALIVSVAWLALSWALPRAEERPAWIAEARSAPLLTWGAWQVNRVLPRGLREEGVEALGALQTPVPAGALELVPQPKDGASDEPSGYKDAERKGMDQAVEGILGDGSGSGGE